MTVKSEPDTIPQKSSHVTMHQAISMDCTVSVSSPTHSPPPDLDPRHPFPQFLHPHRNCRVALQDSGYQLRTSDMQTLLQV